MVSVLLLEGPTHGEMQQLSNADCALALEQQDALVRALRQIQVKVERQHLGNYILDSLKGQIVETPFEPMLGEFLPLPYTFLLFPTKLSARHGHSKLVLR